MVSQGCTTNPTTGKNPYLAAEATNSLDRDQNSQAGELTFVVKRLPIDSKVTFSGFTGRKTEKQKLWD